MTDDDKSQLGGRAAASLDVEIDELKRAARASTDAELASIIGVKPSAVAQWRRRGRIPDKARFKVDNLLFAKERNDRALNFRQTQSIDVVVYSRALALAYCSKGLDKLDAENVAFYAERLRDDALFFEEICAATAIILIRRQHYWGLTAWEAFQKLLTSQFLHQDIHEMRHGGGLAVLRSD